MRCDWSEAGRTVREWGTKLGGVPALAVLSFSRLTRAQSCLALAPHGKPFAFIARQRVWPAGFQGGTNHTFHPQPAFEYLYNLGLPGMVHKCEVCAKVSTKELKRIRKSLSKDQRTIVNIYFESYTTQPHPTKGKVGEEALPRGGRENRGHTVVRHTSNHLLFVATPTPFRVLRKRG